MNDAMSDPTAEPASDMPFAGKTVLVTGRGTIARCIAGAVRDRGARVGLAPACDDDVTLHDIARFHVAFDSESDADGLIDAVVDSLARLDVIIVVVAAEPLDAVHTMTMEQWRRGVVDPLRWLFWMTRRAVEELLANSPGARVVLVLDPASSGERNEVVEDSLRSFARSFAREYGRRALTCNVVVPVISRTAVALVRAHLDAIIEPVLFYASSAASFVNGETLIVELRHQAGEVDERDERR
jgi:NAD(P)-dependent dehydrogenase (short-subunit alcohol dehydrogenase family)